MSRVSRPYNLIFIHRETHIEAVLSLREPVLDDYQITWTGTGDTEFKALLDAQIKLCNNLKIGETNVEFCEQ